MADSKSKSERIGFPPELIQTRLHRLLIETYRQPSEAPKGKIKVSSEVEIKISDDDAQQLVCFSKITVHGECMETEERVFTAECTMIGIFKVNKTFEQNESIHHGDVMLLANYINPLAAETIEANISRAGYGSIQLPRNFKHEASAE